MYTFEKDFIILGYRENDYTNSKGEKVEQYIINIAYIYDKYTGLHVSQSYITKDKLEGISLNDLLENYLFKATCSYNKKLKRLYIEKINSYEERM